MLRTADLVSLASRYRDRATLTVYLHAAVENPAERRMWQVELEHALEPLRAKLIGAGHEERTALHSAIAHLRTWLTAQQEMLRAPGVMAVVSPEEVLFATATDAPVPTLASWGRGVLLSPLLGNASQGAAAAVLVVDTRHTRLYRLLPPRQLEMLETRAASGRADVEHRLGGAVSGFHPGTRGGTAADEAERLQLTERDRLFAAAVERALEVAAPHGWIVIGGTPRSVAAARSLLPSSAVARAIPVEHLDVHASDFDLAVAAAEAVRTREAQRDREVVRGIIEEHGARGRGVAGLVATRSMLERDGVADLYLSEHFVQRFPTETDDLLSRALSQGATIRQVHGEAAAEIDARAEGVVARLRYPVAAVAPAVEVSG